MPLFLWHTGFPGEGMMQWGETIAKEKETELEGEAS
jgi:hypothetical protein